MVGALDIVSLPKINMFLHRYAVAAGWDAHCDGMLGGSK